MVACFHEEPVGVWKGDLFIYGCKTQFEKNRFDFVRTFWVCFTLNIKSAMDSYILISPHAAVRNKNKSTETNDGALAGRDPSPLLG